MIRLLLRLNGLLLLSILLLNGPGLAQNKLRIDSLKKTLGKKLSPEDKIRVWIGLAREYNTSDSASTFFYAQKALKLSREKKLPEGVTLAYYNMGWICLIQGHNPVAREYFSKALKTAQKARYLKGQSRAYNGLGNLYIYKGELGQALKYHHKSLEIAQKDKDTSSISASYNNISLIYQHRGELEKALNYLSKGLKILNKLGEERGVANNYLNQGSIYTTQGEYARALESYFKAAQTYKKLDDKYNLASCYNNIGVTYLNQNKYAEAMDYQLKVLKIDKEMGNRRGEVDDYLNIGNVYLQTREYEEAVKYFFRALRYIEDTNHDSRLGICYLNIGTTFLSQKRYDSAKDYFNKARESCLELEDYTTLSNVEISLGKVYLRQKNYREALRLLDQGVERAYSIGLPSMIRNGAEQLALLHAARGNYREAYEKQRLFQSMADSLENAENTSKIARLQAEYEFQNQKQEIISQKKEQELTFKEEKKRLSLQQNLTLLTLLLVSVFAIVISRYVILKRRANQELAKLNLEVQIKNEEIMAQNEMVNKQKKELEIKNDRLGELNKEKNLLLGIAAHDLKSPLNSIEGLLSLLQDEELSQNEESREYMGLITQLIGRLRAMISQVLDLGAIENSQSINLEAQQLIPLFEEIKEGFKLEASHKNLQLHFESPKTPAIVRADRLYLHQVLENLLSNAIKFSPPGKNIYLSVEEEDYTYRLKIRDEGPGISESDRKKLFFSFQKLSARPTAGEDSSGLGLMIAKKYVDMMEAKIWCESQLGEGATFIIEFTKYS